MEAGTQQLIFSRARPPGLVKDTKKKKKEIKIIYSYLFIYLFFGSGADLCVNHSDLTLVLQELHITSTFFPPYHSDRNLLARDLNACMG